MARTGFLVVCTLAVFFISAQAESESVSCDAVEAAIGSGGFNLSDTGPGQAALGKQRERRGATASVRIHVFLCSLASLILLPFVLCLTLRAISAAPVCL